MSLAGRVATLEYLMDSQLLPMERVPQEQSSSPNSVDSFYTEALSPRNLFRE